MLAPHRLAERAVWPRSFVSAFSLLRVGLCHDVPRDRGRVFSLGLENLYRVTRSQDISLRHWYPSLATSRTSTAAQMGSLVWVSVPATPTDSQVRRGLDRDNLRPPYFWKDPQVVCYSVLIGSFARRMLCAYL